MFCKIYKVVGVRPAKQPNSPEIELSYMLLICKVSIV